MPEVAQALDVMYPQPHRLRSPFGLTEHERAHRQNTLSESLIGLKKGTLTYEEAVRALEYCAALIEDDSLPETVERETLVHLLRPVIGRAVGSFKASTTVPVRDARKGDEAELRQISLIRGVVLNLTGDLRLVSVTISPAKVREWRKLQSFVGIASDAASDVAERHDDYLAEIYSDATS